MIPLPDDFLLEYAARSVAWLKKHPQFIDQIFHTSRRETVVNMQKFLTEKTVHVRLGYPRDQTGLPAFSIIMAPETEEPLGVGDEEGTFDRFYAGTQLYPEAADRDLTEEEQAVADYAEDQLRQYLESTGMRAAYRIECWADNADLVTYMYAILKWIMWGCRRDMYRLHWTDVTISGMDLEPMTEYMPVFVYRRALQISMMYENLYYTDVGALDKYGRMIREPGAYIEDPEVTQDEDSWILCPHYYSERISGYAI